MRTTHQRPAPASVLGARAIVLFALLAALLVMMGQTHEARATHGRSFAFLTSAATVDEGEALELEVLVGGDSTSPSVNVGFNVQLVSAEPGDVQGDFCLSVPMGAYPPVTSVFIQTFADADTADETFTVEITFSDAAIDGCEPNAGPAGHEAYPAGVSTVTVTINDTGTGGGTGNTFHFETAGSTGEEGDTLTVEVVRTGDLNGTASVNCIALAGGTAEGADYDILDGTANFGNNDPSGTCSIRLEADADTDVIETLVIGLSNPSTGHTLAEPDEHTITILDPGAEVVQFSAATYSVNENGGIASFTITRTNPSGDDNFVCTSDEITNEADENEDFDATADAINFTGTQATRTCTVPINDDDDFEGNETFRLVLTKVSGDAVLGPIDEAIVTIVDNETSGVTFEFSAANYNVSEAGGTVTITIERSTSTGTGSVQWATGNGTAVSGADYLAAAGTATFSPGETQETFTVTILQDNLTEGNETINLTLSSPVNGSLGTQDMATITILDDEGAPTITSISPNSGPTSGGTSVTITGTNFTGATAVTFGGTNATSFTVNNSTQITAVSPPRSAGTVDIRVTTPSGQSANTAADNFTYQAATTNTYQLSFRWTLIAWLGQDNMSISNALQGIETPPNAATNNILPFVTAIATWDAPAQRYLFWFPGGANVPGANDITTFRFGSAYWVAVTSGVSWTIVQGP